VTDRITIELKGEAELQARLDHLARGLANTEPLMRAIGAKLEANVNHRFDTKLDPTGAPWAPLSKLTAQFHTITGGHTRNPSKQEWKDLRKGKVTAAELPGSLLERTRRLRKSLAVNAGPGWVEIGMLRLTDNGKWNVAALHEYGTKTMPARRLLTADPNTGTLGEQDRADVYQVIENYLASIGASGG
jgi:phage gpG-like protein